MEQLERGTELQKHVKMAISTESLQRIRGLSNLGNTCFFNAVMQCLAQTPFLTTIFTNEVVLPGGFKLEDDASASMPEVKIEYYSNVEEIIPAFKDILEELQTSGGVYNPSKFFHKFTTQYPQFGGGDQHDSHELLRHLLDSVIIAERNIYRMLLLRSLFNGRKFKSLNPAEVKILEAYANQAKDRYLIERVFQGSLESTLKCEDCSHTSPNSEKFLDISLPVSVDITTKSMPLQSYLRQKSNPEPLPALSKRQLKKEKRKTKREKTFACRSENDSSAKEKLDDNSDNSNTDDDDNSDNSSSESNNIQTDSDELDLCKNIVLSASISREGKHVIMRKHSNIGKTNITNDSDNAHDDVVIDNGLNNAIENNDTRIIDSCLTIGPPYISKDNECSVQTCLNSFTATELLSDNNKVGCEQCTKQINGENGKTVNTNATKQFLISSLPAVLILHLKRFQIGPRHTFRKLSTHVTFPFTLDMGPYCAASPQIIKKNRTISRNQKKILYSLYGVVEHSGGMHGGHYTAYVKVRPKITATDPRWKFVSKLYNEQRGKANDDANDTHLKNGYDSDDSVSSTAFADVTAPQGKWYYVSDSRVSEVTADKVLNAQAYLLFYERIF